MIERGHEHRMTPASIFEPGDGTRIIHLRCTSQAATTKNPTPCAMEEQRTYRGDTLVGVKIRLLGVWFHPFDLIRSMPLSVQECEACGGDDQLVPCEACGGLGVEALGGGPLVAPDLRVTA